ncbi:leucine-rich repeat protein, partial [Mycoplasma sp. VS292A]|uniref:leucine-rich repeat protein n=1 Tax=Mycoplasma sp. VS292A TaxID=3401680 RepID=UPI003AADAF70
PKLKEVGYDAFYNTPKLTSKVVGDGILFKWSNASGDIFDDSITSIGAGVFKNNQNIISASFPNVKTIGEQSFSGATNLTSVDMPNLKEIGWSAFVNTPKLINKPTVKTN